MHRRRRLVTRLVVLAAAPLLLLTLLATSMLLADAEWTTAGQPHQPLSTLPTEAQPASGACERTRDDLLKQLEQLKKLVRQLEQRLQQQQGTAGSASTGSSPSRNELPCSSAYIQKQIEQSEMERGKRWHNEYEIVPHSFFTLGAFYATETGMGRRVVERPIGTRRQDLQEAVGSALSVLAHHEHGGARYSAQDFTEGLYRIDPVEGTQYELWFRARNKSSNSSTSSDLIKVALIRPHAPITAVRFVKNTNHAPATINVIVPLSGRLGAFQAFLNRFRRNVLSSPDAGDIHLTVVVFGDESWAGVQREVLAFEKASHFSKFHLLNINSTFSRARGLQAGVDHWEGSQDNVIVFFCDVDVDFDHVFIDRCRRNTVRKRQAYFPIVFSQFNPNVTRRLSSGHHKDAGELHRLHKDAGFWRDFGFGMVCAYRSDFVELGGFRGGDDTSGWGGEDLFLYRKFIRSTLRVVRSPDPNLFHLWHVKHCPNTLSLAQRRACLQSKGRNEASYDQLALLLFANDTTFNNNNND